ncbi:MAG: sulfide-dependent adenosine diphosphate thiazole synthase [Candidatus Jordarchaeales archaeon]
MEVLVMELREVPKEVDEVTITRAIVRSAAEDWIRIADSDVVVVGAGPSGLTAARYVAEAGFRTVVFERRLSYGGGIGGGGMLWHKVVVSQPADEILREVGCRLEKSEDGVYVVDAAEMLARLATAAIDAGVKVIFGVTVEDLMYALNPLRITGVVVQWSAVNLAGLHVDPVAVRAKAVIDCTGHDAEVLRVASKKIPELNLEVVGERSMNAPSGERFVVEKTGEVCPGLYVSGMAVCALHGGPRMGPIFGGMLLSGKKVAGEVVRRLSKY